MSNEGLSVKPCTLPILLAGLGLAACNPPTAPKDGQHYCRFISFDVPADCGGSQGPPQQPQVAFTAVNVSPAVVHAGDHFTASASATFVGCLEAFIYIDYANHRYDGDPASPSSFTVSLTAVLGDTVVMFETACGSLNTQGWSLPVSTVTIQVLPAQ